MDEKDYKKQKQELIERIEWYAALIRSTYLDVSEELIKLAVKVEHEFSPNKPFRFDEYPEIIKRAELKFNELQKRIYNIIENAKTNERLQADIDTGKIISSVVGEKAKNMPEYKPFFPDKKPDMTRAFLEKPPQLALPPAKPPGGPDNTPPGEPSSGQPPLTPRRFNLSNRVWELTGDFRNEIQQIIDGGIRDGLSAKNMAERVQKYLKEPDRFYRRFHFRDKEAEDEWLKKHPDWEKKGLKKPDEIFNPSKWKRRIMDEKTGKYRWIDESPENYNPGRGVYRSSYKNALRLTRTEINMAYHEQAYNRWQQLDFVVGFRVELSGAHPEKDICDELKGEYPKSFKFLGWHPQCMCHAIALIRDKDNEVNDVPDHFKKWVEDNEGRIEKANNRGTLPYFLQDNAKFAGISVNKIN
jgi:hypothetical protein